MEQTSLLSITKFLNDNPKITLGQLMNSINLYYKKNMAEISDKEIINYIQKIYETEKTAKQEKTTKICPCCKRVMLNNSKIESGYDEDYEYYVNYKEIFICPKCETKYKDGEWEIDKNFVATEKQIKTGHFIENVTNIAMPPPTKQNLWKYINENLQNALKQWKHHYEANMEQYCTDNWEYIPPADELC